MALKDTWIDKVDNVDEINASDINNIAQSVIDIENEPKIVIDGMMLDESENPVQNKVVKTYVDDGYHLLSVQTTNLDSRIYQLDANISNLTDRILNVETNKADISYVDNAISSAINEALEGNY